MTEAPEQHEVIQNEAPDSQTLPFPVVGIGASAGGIEAYIDLLHNLPTDTGMAFVLVPHLAPDHKSHLVEILQSHTQLPISTIENGVQPQPNHIYILPPNQFASICQGILRLEKRSDKVRGTLAIDYFFRSLALDQKNMAVGVVLSGMNSDGATGLKAIKAEGGIALVQEPSTARHPDMPLSSIAADHVDLIVPPAEIAAELGRLGRLYSHPELRTLEEGKAAPTDQDVLRKIFHMLRGFAGLDFGLYKPGTVNRRISRRLLVTQTESLTGYLKLLESSPDELRLLHEDLLVGLTWFFRDPDMFDALKTIVFPKIFEARKPHQQVRIWVAGCSTGEETYSIVMALLEYTSAHNLEPVIQVFGTDVSDRSIEKARTGCYPDSVATEISAERMRRFFVKVDKGYQVSKRVRDLCVFARQNLCNDPPFSKVDLVTCRNVLIYLGQQLQKRVIPSFHYALKPEGFLVLGRSEALRDFAEIFDPVDRKNKIFAKLEASNLIFELPRFVPASSNFPSSNLKIEPAATWSSIELQHAADRVVLAGYAPPGIVLNERFEILQSRGQMGPYLDLAQGTTSFHLLRMLRPSIAHTVRDAVERAIALEIPVRVEGLKITGTSEDHEFAIEVFPIQVLRSSSKCYLVLFVAKNVFLSRMASERSNEERSADVPSESDTLAQLRQDLNAIKFYLQSLIEERDFKNQELTSSNEEVQSANEELQSTNEELETTKEELQSTNEELQTVNDELQQRNSVLTETANDITNLLTSVNIPVLMLNNALQIRQFTPLAQKLLSVRPTDIGRPIREIRMNFVIEDLEPVLLDVLDTLATREVEVQDCDGRWHLLRIRPYRTNENKIDGVVMVLLEIDQLRRSQVELSEARDLGRDLIEAVQFPLLILESNLTIRSANSAFRLLTGLSRDELQGRQFPDITLREWGLSSIRELLEGIGFPGTDSAFFEGELEIGTEGRIIYMRARAVQANETHVLLVTLEDITERKRASQILARENQFLAGQVRSTSQALGQTQQELRALAARLFTSQEEERRRVARELHDDVGQRLALLQMNIEQVPHRLAQDPGSLNHQMADLRSSITALSDDVRELSHKLHPAMLDDLGLGHALESLVKEFGEREQMPATLTRRNVPESLNKEIGATLYRIAQEALRNISKHAGKTHGRIVLEGIDNSLHMAIIDMGEGFDREARVEGLGLLSMAERAHLVGGTFEIKSELGRGTSVTVTVPLTTPAN